MHNTFKLAVGVFCCLQVCNSVVNMVVMGLVGQSLMVISIYYLLFTCEVNCLQTCAIKGCVCEVY